MNTCKKSEQRVILQCGIQAEHHNCLHYKKCFYRGAGKSLAQPTSRCILFDGQNISFHASLDIYI